MAGTWQRLGTVSGDGSSGTLSVSFTAKKNIKIIAYTKTSAGSARFRVGNGSLDSGNNYASRISSNGGSEDITTSISGNSYTATTPIQWDMEITNIADEEKLWISHLVRQSTAGAGTAPSRVEEVMKWVNTSNQIDTVGFVCTDGSGTFSSDSYITVFGASSDVTTDEKDSLTNVPAGTRYEETDTRKIYRKVTPTQVSFSDDFSSDGWTDRGSNVGVSGGAITWSNCAMGADNGTSKSITALSDTKWVMRFKFTPTAMNIPNQWIMWAVDQVGNPDSTAQDGIGVVLHDTYKLRLGTKTDSTAYYNQGASGDIMSSTLSNNTTYYIELARTSATNARLKYFSDSTYETQIDSTINVTITSSISGLDNLSTGVQSGGSSSRTMSATLDDLKIYNGVTSVDTNEWKERGTA